MLRGNRQATARPNIRRPTNKLGTRATNPMSDFTGKSAATKRTQCQALRISLERSSRARRTTLLRVPLTLPLCSQLGARPALASQWHPRETGSDYPTHSLGWWAGARGRCGVSGSRRGLTVRREAKRRDREAAESFHAAKAAGSAQILGSRHPRCFSLAENGSNQEIQAPRRGDVFLLHSNEPSARPRLPCEWCSATRRQISQVRAVPRSGSARQTLQQPVWRGITVKPSPARGR